MELKLFLSILGIILLIGMFGHYYYGIFKGTIKPHSYTWLVFTLILGLSFIIQQDNSGGWGSYILLVDTLACFIAFLLALKYGEKDIRPADKISLGVALIAIILWLFFDIPVLSVLLIIFIDLFGLIPTFRKSYHKPYQESINMFFLSGVIFLLSVLAIENYSFLTVGHQVAIIIFDWGLVLFLLYRRKLLSKN